VNYVKSGYNFRMEMWYLVAGCALVAVVNAVISMVLIARSRGSDTREYVLKLDQLEADVDYLSGRITKAQKQTAAQASVASREDAKSLKDEATIRLSSQGAQAKAQVRPSVIPIRG